MCQQQSSPQRFFLQQSHPAPHISSHFDTVYLSLRNVIYDTEMFACVWRKLKEKRVLGSDLKQKQYLRKRFLKSD